MVKISLSEIGAELEADIVSIVQGAVKEECMKTLTKYVNAVYERAPSAFYHRTMQFLNAVTVKASVGGNSANIEIFVDSNKLHMASSLNRIMFNSHMGWSEQDFRAPLVQKLDGEFGFYDKTYDDLDNKVVKIMAGALRSAGWDVTFS